MASSFRYRAAQAQDYAVLLAEEQAVPEELGGSLGRAARKRGGRNCLLWD